MCLLLATVLSRAGPCADTIQRRIQRTIKEILGYSMAVNQLVRGVIRQQARVQPLDAFIHQTDTVLLSKRTRLIKWIAQNG